MALIVRSSLLLLALLGIALLPACSDDDAVAMAPALAGGDLAPALPSEPPLTSSTEDMPQAAEQAEPAPPTEPVRVVGDLDAIKRHGQLRILIPANVGGAFYLPRSGWPVEAQHEAAERFALANGLEAELVPVEAFSDMIPALLDGRGDIIAANLTVTDERRKRIAFSVPITTVRQQVIVAADNDAINAAADLAGKRVMIDPGSAFWPRIAALRETYPDIELVPRPDGLSDEEELDRVASGVVDAAVRDSNVAAMYLRYREDLRVAFRLPHVDDIAWGMRPDAHDLRAALNKFLHLEFVADNRKMLSKADYDGIRKRRVLRVLLPNNAASYFLHRGELHGFDYELAKAFAKAHGLRLEVIVPETHEQLTDWLLEGRADIAGGFLEPNDAARARGVAFTRPYHYAPRHLVVATDSPVDAVDKLDGLTVSVRRSSPSWQYLEELRANGAALNITAVDEDIETEELIAAVAAGEIEATVADGHVLDIELARGLAVKSALRISEEIPHAVAVRADNPKLLKKLDAYIKKAYKGLVYNILYKKYFANPHKIRDLAAGRNGDRSGKGLSPYDDITRKYAERYGFDWRLITAQMYQESRFDPKAESFAGAQGLLQVMPRTAKFMGFKKLNKPEDGIHAGVKYLDWVRNRFEDSLPFSERLWFSLAAYNAGHGHVADARRLAQQKGWDPDAWFDNAEKAMLLLSKKQYAKKARYGYVRGIEPVSYVRNIRSRYRAYTELAEEMRDTPPGPALVERH